MAWINRILVTLCALPFTTLLLTLMVRAPKQARGSSTTTYITKKADKRKSTATTKKIQKTAKKTASESTAKSKVASSVKKSSTTASRNAKTRSRHTVNKTTSTNFTEKYIKRKDYKSRCVKVKNATPGVFTDAYKAKAQKATKVAMNKLVQQIDKPYRWGGGSPRTGFDCNSLVYYACKDLVKIRIPRTANETYHLRDAVPIGRSELKNSNLAFFHTQGRGIAGHIGVYVGNGELIQSPHTGWEIQITSFNEDYWQRHYVGVHRVVTPKILRQNLTLLLRRQGKFIFCFTF